LSSYGYYSRSSGCNNFTTDDQYDRVKTTTALNLYVLCHLAVQYVHCRRYKFATAVVAQRAVVIGVSFLQPSVDKNLETVSSLPNAPIFDRFEQRVTLASRRQISFVVAAGARRRLSRRTFRALSFRRIFASFVICPSVVSLFLRLSFVLFFEVGFAPCALSFTARAKEAQSVSRQEGLSNEFVLIFSYHNALTINDEAIRH